MSLVTNVCDVKLFFLVQKGIPFKRVFLSIDTLKEQSESFSPNNLSLSLSHLIKKLCCKDIL